MHEQFWKWSFFILFLLWLFIRIPYSKRSLKTKSKKKERVATESFLVFLNSISMMFLPVYAVFSTRLDFAAMNLPSWVRWIGLILYGLNLLLFVWCHKTLGKNWSTILEIRESHELIQKGPYKRIRHPMYTFFWLLIISQGLIINNWIVMIYGILAWGALYFLRVGREEQMMIEEFGDKYKKYMKQTGRLLPKNKDITRWGIGPQYAVISILFSAIIIIINLNFLPNYTFILFNKMLSTVVGIILIAIGIFLFLIPAQRVMRYFKEEKLCMTGIYSYVRHPIYACWIIAIVPGIIIICGLSLAIIIPFFMYLVFKILIKREDEYLIKKFGKEYRDYKKKVGEIFPKTVSKV